MAVAATDAAVEITVLVDGIWRVLRNILDWFSGISLSNWLRNFC